EPPKPLVAAAVPRLRGLAAIDIVPGEIGFRVRLPGKFNGRPSEGGEKGRADQALRGLWRKDILGGDGEPGRGIALNQVRAVPGDSTDRVAIGFAVLGCRIRPGRVRRLSKKFPLFLLARGTAVDRKGAGRSDGRATRGLGGRSPAQLDARFHVSGEEIPRWSRRRIDAQGNPVGKAGASSFLISRQHPIDCPLARVGSLWGAGEKDGESKSSKP